MKGSGSERGRRGNSRCVRERVCVRKRERDYVCVRERERERVCERGGGGGIPRGAPVGMVLIFS